VSSLVEILLIFALSKFFSFLYRDSNRYLDSWVTGMANVGVDWKKNMTNNLAWIEPSDKLDKLTETRAGIKALKVKYNLINRYLLLQIGTINKENYFFDLAFIAAI
jgi:hypothetical protein